jgi:ferredoxin
VYADPSRGRRSSLALDRRCQLLYSAPMPAGVIVVKQSQRRFFAGPRALPGWLRSFWLARSRRSEKGPDDDDRSAILRLPSADLMPSIPSLDVDVEGAHRCNGCGLCALVCPSRCLRLTNEGKGASLEVTVFEIARSSCIACGICCEVCPEDAIEMSRELDVETVGGDGRLPVTDLLTVGG